MSRVTALFGGSFDPIHEGHLALASELVARCDFEKIYFVPAQRNPLKSHATSATGEQRLRMLELALAERGEARFGVLDWEIRRPAPSYTLTTLQEWGRTHGSPLALIMGNEVFLGLPRWHQPLEVLSRADLVVAIREGALPTDIPAVLSACGARDIREVGTEVYTHSQSHSVTVQRLPILPVSGTALRAILLRHSPGTEAPQGIGRSVWQFIKENHLYAVS